MNGEQARPAPDLDKVLDAVVEFVASASYRDAVRRCDEVDITRCWYAVGGDARPTDRAKLHGVELRRAAVVAEDEARGTLFAQLDHERAMSLIPRLSETRHYAATRGEDAYAALEDAARTEQGAVDEAAEEDGAGS